MVAETLATCAAIEEASFIQTRLYEITHPGVGVKELLNLDGGVLRPIDAATDCNDLYEVLIQPAAPCPSNKALSLCLAMLREEGVNRKVRAWLWISTHDQLANVLTKISADGTLPL